VDSGVGVAVGRVVVVVCVVFDVVTVVIIVVITVAGADVVEAVVRVVEMVGEAFREGMGPEGNGVISVNAAVDSNVPGPEYPPATFPANPSIRGCQKTAAITIITRMPTVAAAHAGIDLPLAADAGSSGSLVPHWVQNFWD
jgi:hypothetical protein